MSFECRPITAQECIPLRSEVLRPNHPLEDCRFPLDEESQHFGAFNHGKLVSIVSAHGEEKFGEPKAWRIRGMATAPSLQGSGAGAAVLNAMKAWAREQNIPLLWFNARVKAIPFYERHGFTTESELFDMPGVGPHKVMKGRP
jgi:GNAT superfamily N-acetyltransferase